MLKTYDLPLVLTNRQKIFWLELDGDHLRSPTMRVLFEDVFRVKLDGKITPKTRIRFSADPVVTEVLHGTSVDLKKTNGMALIVGKDQEVLMDGDVMVILRQYG